MSFTTFSGPVRAGTVKEGAARNTGLLVLSQSFDTGVVTAGAGNVDTLAAILPAGSQIINILVDQVVVPGGTSTSTISVGTTSGTANLMAAVITTAGGRFVGTTTATTQLAWQTSTTADTSVFVRYAVGVAAGVGRAIVTVVYAQRDSNGAQFPASV
jgi:lysylphosphatidylglycerol synthetase-like protein (DUF2156 family)